MEKNKELEINITTFSEKELKVCLNLHFVISQKNCICDPTNFSSEEEEIIEDFERKGYLIIDGDCIIIKKEFYDFMNKLVNTEVSVGSRETSASSV